ncbi:type II toxin-antitoxin system RelE/ParE family toxin [Planococcus kocurii]|uniref:type II toxin-antitoxin system RelE/ParE family toxin n=1 Tax=Planococcus TaxID=1372 RepID=UPI001F117CA0|nr:type II toxin-antitoxin system RelE/ParE family toxin [Planococcus halocryophilus]MCH4827521.1 type II toxin-antitoxin system RelE/ParE family toxin [Planococcus halocryophilus]
MKVVIDNHGSRSCQAWIDNLEKTDRIAYKKLNNELVYLEMFGKEMLKGGNKPQSIKPLTDTDGIWQIRIDDYRVLFFYYESNAIVVTNGFTKKRATTPKGEIKKAKSVKNLYT